MPRIRKKTSKRGTTNERRKIHNKVRESRKKKAKAAKNNTQWKSKHKKDPGIPNNFPFKDQILAEVAEQRRLAAEEKQRKKEAKKTLQESNAEEGLDNEDGAEGDVEDGDDEDFEGVASIGAKRLIRAKATTKPVSEEVEDELEDDEDDVPILINRDLPHLQAVLDQADIVIQVLDARDPLSFRSKHLEEVVASKEGRRMVFVLNKVDVCPQESVASWASVLRQDYPTFLFRSASSCLPVDPFIVANVKGKGKAKPADDAIGLDSILEYIGHLAKENETTTVAVVGIVNSGKSSFVNSLLKKTSLPVYSLSSSSRGPTTTTLPQDVTFEIASKKIRVIDTPGFIWEVDKTALDAENARARDILLRNKGRIDRLKDPSLTVAHIVSRSSAEDLMLLYNLPIFPKGDIDAFLTGMARSQQLVKKKGALDLPAASKVVLRDWSVGKLHWYSAPSTNQPTAESSHPKSDDTLEGLYAKDVSILETLSPRKVMRKAVGLVRLTPGEVDARKVALENTYSADEEDSDDDDDNDRMDVDGGYVGEEDEEDEGSEEEHEDEDQLVEDDDDDDDEEEELVPEEAAEAFSRKQKRKRATETSLPPSKKVTFAISSKSRSLKGDSVPKPSKPAPKALKAPKGKRTPSVLTNSQKATLGEEAYDFGKFF